MKFVRLHSRGGDYLVVVANIAWLRAGENDQTNVGIVGSTPLVLALLFVLVFAGRYGLLNTAVLGPLGLPAVDWLKDMPGLHARVVHGLRLSEHLILEGDHNAMALRGYLTDLYQAIAGTGAFDERPHRRFILAAQIKMRGGFDHNRRTDAV